MGVSHSPAQLSGKLGRLTADYADLPRSTVADASQTTKKIVKGIAPSRLRGAGKRGAKLDVGYNLIGRGTEASSLVYARGPWQLIERDTSPHQIPRARGPRARKRYVVFGGNIYARAAHPGTKGQHPWRKGTEVARPVVGALFRTQAVAPLRRIF